MHSCSSLCPSENFIHALELEDLFDDNSVSSYTVTHSLNLERQVCTQRAFLQAPPAVSHVTHRQRGARLLRALVVTGTLPPQTCEFTLQVIDVTQGWSNAVAERINHTDLLAMVAAVYVFVELRYTPKQRYLRSLCQGLEAFAALLSRRSLYAAPALRDEHIVRQIVHQEISPRQHLEYEVAILTPIEWI